MNRIEQAIANADYVKDCLKALNEIYKSGSCNDCAKERCCKYAPQLGQMVRYNCYFYERKEPTR